jgi:class 3 adenylate cyclase/predicted ATPase
MDVGGWLRNLGLPQYEATFRENEIDDTVLPNLTAEDLKDLGVGIVGHRRKLLDAIATLRADADKTPPPSLAKIDNSTTHAPLRAAAAPPPIPTTPRELTGERRYVTVMFYDLVGSTGIASRLDAEEWRDLVGAYLDAASAAVTEMGGHVAKRLGDGLMALFGYPVAHENDAERAARAALSIQRALTELNRNNTGSGKPELAARIGLETGPAVLDATGDIYGGVANVAARVQALAEPGAIMITAQVQRQIAGLFVAEERGRHELKGVPEPVALFKLVRASGGGRRVTQRSLTPLIGRNEEIAILMRRWERARQGEGQFILIIGEPGVGKSRLLTEFHSRLREVPHTWAEWNCSQLLQNTPLHPLAEWSRTRFGSAEVPAERRLADLESSLAQIALDPAENVPLLAPILEIPLPQKCLLGLAPEELRRRQLAALTNWPIASAKVQPVVLAVEDLHWADPTTIEVLRSIAERGALAPLFVVATTRPEFRLPWGMRSHHSTLSLAPLDRSQVREMVAELSARHALAKDVVEEVAARTSGVPLFVEEVTRLLLERGEQGGRRAIPPTLQQSLMARLDRLGPAREVAQIGAVIGREFSYALIRAIAGMHDVPLQAALESLAEADILLVQGMPPHSDYRLKHALIQDAAYENLLKSRRQALHRKVAETLRDDAIAAVEPELLAHHFTQAGLAETAIEWWGKAGQRSLERSALVEAAEQFMRALDLIRTLPSTPALRRKEIKLQVALITPLIHVKGYSAPETKAAAEQARLLIEQTEARGEPPEDPLLLFSVLYGIWSVNFVRANGDAPHEIAAQFLALAEKQRATAMVMTGHRLMGHSLLFLGGFAQARAHYDEVVRLYDPDEHRSLAAKFGQDARVPTLSYRSLTLWVLGYPDTAVRDIEQALSDARQIGQAPTLLYALSKATSTLFQCGEYARASAVAEEAIALADEKGTLIWKAYGMMEQGCILALTGHSVDAVPTLASGIAAYRSTGSTLWLPIYLSYLARAYAEVGQFDDAWRCVVEATTAIETGKQRWCKAEVHRVAGEIALMSPEQDAVKARGYFQHAIDVARAQQAKSWELRAAMSMARLWRDQGKRDAARDLLAPIYGWFTEGFDTLDLKEAKALLDTLAR